jgi:hypothetical protein
LDIPPLVDSLADENVITLDNYYKGFKVNSKLKYEVLANIFYNFILSSHHFQQN